MLLTIVVANRNVLDVYRAVDNDDYWLMILKVDAAGLPGLYTSRFCVVYGIAGVSASESCRAAEQLGVSPRKHDILA